MPFQKIIKRDGTEVPFKIEKISIAIEKAFIADGGQLDHNSAELAEAVVLFLEKNQVKKPHIEEIQDMVETVLANLGYARVGQVYKRFREKRRIARGRLFVEEDHPEDYQEIYNPVIVVKNQQKQSVSPWDAKIIQKKLMDELELPFDELLPDLVVVLAAGLLPEFDSLLPLLFLLCILLKNIFAKVSLFIIVLAKTYLATFQSKKSIQLSW